MLSEHDLFDYKMDTIFGIFGWAGLMLCMRGVIDYLRE
jgi:hypothetical protein